MNNFAYVFHFAEAVRKKKICRGLDGGTVLAERSVEESGRRSPSAGEHEGETLGGSEPDGLPKGVLLFILNQRDLEAAELFLLAKGQEGLKMEIKGGKYESLLPKILQKKDPRGIEVELVVVAGRLGDNLRIGYDKSELPVL